MEEAKKVPEDKNGKIPFKIDKNHHEINHSQNPVSGQFLRNLAPAISEEYDLWLRGRGQEDDIIVEPGDSITVKNGDHFYTAKRVITPGTFQQK
jgi:hypothetical protein